MKYFSIILMLLIATLINGQSQILETNDGNLKMTPILHATMVLEWKDLTIYMDPYGGAELFKGFSDADIICITHPHGDHLNKETLQNLNVENTLLIAPQSVVDNLGPLPFKEIRILANDQVWNDQGVKIQAFPMYNLPDDETSRHPKGWGNAYILEIGGTRLYISGDTEDIPEMRNLENIDYAFVCMNLPYTMTVAAAADAVLDFKPKVVFPFHFRGKDGFSDVQEFKSKVNEVNSDIEVRLLDWYPNQ